MGIPYNLTMIYRNADDAWLAKKMLEQSGGGIVVVANGTILAKLVLPVAGLMSDLPIEQLAPEVARVERAVYDLCEGESSLLKMSMFALAALSGAIMTDKRIVDGNIQEFIPLFRHG